MISFSSNGLLSKVYHTRWNLVLCAETAAKGVCSGSMESISSSIVVYFVGMVLLYVINGLSIDVAAGRKRCCCGRKGE